MGGTAAGKWSSICAGFEGEEDGRDRHVQSYTDLSQTWQRWIVYRNPKIYRPIHARTTKPHVTAACHNHQSQGAGSPVPLRDPCSSIEVPAVSLEHGYRRATRPTTKIIWGWRWISQRQSGSQAPSNPRLIMGMQYVACCWVERGYGLQGAPTAGQIHEGYTSLPSPACPPAGRECLLVWKMGRIGGTARRPLNKNAANRQASFLVLGPLSSCAMADQQKQAELHAKHHPELLTRPR